MMDVAITIGALTMPSLLPKSLGVIFNYVIKQKMTPTLFWQRTNLEQIWQFFVNFGQKKLALLLMSNASH